MTVAEVRQELLRLRDDLAKLSVNNRQVMVSGSGHEIHLYEPDVVVGSISDGSVFHEKPLALVANRVTVEPVSSQLPVLSRSSHRPGVKVVFLPAQLYKRGQVMLRALSQRTGTPPPHGGPARSPRLSPAPHEYEHPSRPLLAPTS
jgi:hypothetical protein